VQNLRQTLLNNLQCHYNNDFADNKIKYILNPTTTQRVKFVSSFIKQFAELMFFRFMVFNATFNNISVISCWSVLLVEETGIPGENH